MQRMKETTPEQRREILARVETVRKAEGLSLADAWQKAGHGHMTNYYTWKRKDKRRAAKSAKRAYKRRKAITVEAAPAPHIVAQFVLFSDGNIVNLQDLKRAA